MPKERRSPLRPKKTSSSAADLAKQKKKDAKKKAKVGSVRSKNFTQLECDMLWDIMDDICPTGGSEWKRVEEAFNRKMGGQSNRTADSLKLKFKKYKIEKKPQPTGDPDCPPNVVRAKVCKHAYQFLLLLYFIERNFSHFEFTYICMYIF
jgi:hypothetical protein